MMMIVIISSYYYLLLLLCCYCCYCYIVIIVVVLLLLYCYYCCGLYVVYLRHIQQNHLERRADLALQAEDQFHVQRGDSTYHINVNRSFISRLTSKRATSMSCSFKRRADLALQAEDPPLHNKETSFFDEDTDSIALI